MPRPNPYARAIQILMDRAAMENSVILPGLWFAAGWLRLKGEEEIAALPGNTRLSGPAAPAPAGGPLE